MKVVIATELIRTTYGEFAGSTLSLPVDSQQWPSTDALEKHLVWSGISVEPSLDAAR
jgi:hypothetical protein